MKKYVFYCSDINQFLLFNFSVTYSLLSAQLDNEYEHLHYLGEL